MCESIRYLGACLAVFEASGARLEAGSATVECRVHEHAAGGNLRTLHGHNGQHRWLKPVYTVNPNRFVLCVCKVCNVYGATIHR